MKISDFSLAVWRECNACVRSSGKLLGGADCWKCKGLGKRPLFIPLEELELQDPGRDLWASIRKWLEKNR